MTPPDCCDDHCPKCCVYCANAATVPTSHPTQVPCGDPACHYCRNVGRGTLVVAAAGDATPPAPNRAERRRLEAIARKGGDPAQALRKQHRGRADTGSRPSLPRGSRLAPSPGSRGDR